jgi:hypothetical protein
MVFCFGKGYAFGYSLVFNFLRSTTTLGFLFFPPKTTNAGDDAGEIVPKETFWTFPPERTRKGQDQHYLLMSFSNREVRYIDYLL